MPVPQMVQNVLLSNNGIPSCGGTISNVTWKAGSNASSKNGIGTFTNTNPNFPMTSGMILSTGDVANAPGPNTSTQSFGSNTWTGDTQLFNYMIAQGLIVNTYLNATILEFDFIPLTNIMNFDFVFASEEYGAYQCEFSDAFAFLKRTSNSYHIIFCDPFYELENFELLPELVFEKNLLKQRLF